MRLANIEAYNTDIDHIQLKYEGDDVVFTWQLVLLLKKLHVHPLETVTSSAYSRESDFIY